MGASSSPWPSRARGASSWDGPPPPSDTPCKVSANSDSTRCSRTSTPACWVRRTLTCTGRPCTWRRQPQQSSLQTLPIGTFPTTLRAAAPKIYAAEGMNGFYKSLVPLWGRQIPYTMMKFACFERTVEALYQYVVPKPRAECSKGEQLVVTFAAGYIAGVFCAIVSHPADTIVSYMNKSQGSTVGSAAKALGFKGMWGGLVPRIVMIGTLTALQWFIYDGVKVQLRLPRPPPPEMPESLKKKMAAAQA